MLFCFICKYVPIFIVSKFSFLKVEYASLIYHQRIYDNLKIKSNHDNIRNSKNYIVIPSVYFSKIFTSKINLRIQKMLKRSRPGACKIIANVTIITNYLMPLTQN